MRAGERQHVEPGPAARILEARERHKGNWGTDWARRLSRTQGKPWEAAVPSTLHAVSSSSGTLRLRCPSAPPSWKGMVQGSVHSRLSHHPTGEHPAGIPRALPNASPLFQLVACVVCSVTGTSGSQDCSSSLLGHAPLSCLWPWLLGVAFATRRSSARWPKMAD